MEEQENEIFVDDSEKEAFVFHTQKFCWYNWEISIQDLSMTEEERLALIDQAMEQSEFVEGELEEVIQHDWLVSLLDGYDTGKNPIGWHLTAESMSELVVVVAQRLLSDSAEELVKNGEADLLWDAEKEDFIIRAKG